MLGKTPRLEEEGSLEGAPLLGAHHLGAPHPGAPHPAGTTALVQDLRLPVGDPRPLAGVPLHPADVLLRRRVSVNHLALPLAGPFSPLPGERATHMLTPVIVRAAALEARDAPCPDLNLGPSPAQCLDHQYADVLLPVVALLRLASALSPALDHVLRAP